MVRVRQRALQKRRNRRFPFRPPCELSHVRWVWSTLWSSQVPAATRSYYRKVYDALQQWLANEFPFWRPYYSNAELPH
jgi:hypothetical protein